MSAVRRCTWPMVTPGSIGRGARWTGTTPPWMVVWSVMAGIVVPAPAYTCPGMEQRSDGPHASLALLRDRVVSKLLAVELFSGLAQGATATALGWQAYGRRHDPFVLGLLGLAEFIPAVALALPAGDAPDRPDRRRGGRGRPPAAGPARPPAGGRRRHRRHRDGRRAAGRGRGVRRLPGVAAVRAGDG